jgi:hypothetical protein
MMPKNTAKVIMYLLKNVDEFGLNINKIAKLNKISVGSSFKILKDLEKKLNNQKIRLVSVLSQ